MRSPRAVGPERRGAARLPVLALGVLVSVAACTSDEWPPLPQDESSTDPDEDDDDDDFSEFDDARLEVFEPVSGEIYDVTAPVPLRALVRRDDGPSLPVEDVAWLGTDGQLLWEGLEGDLALPPGRHDLRVVARLPNDDRLEATVGGVRVQAPWTGEYVGDLDLTVEVEFQGFPISPRCSGPFDMKVAPDGVDVEVEPGSCTVEVAGQTFPGSYTVDVVVFPAGLVRGTVFFAFDSPVGPLELPVEWAGAFYDDRFSAGLSDDTEFPVIGDATVSGSLQAQLVDRYVDED